MPSCRPVTEHHTERGFILVGVLLLILCVTAIISSFTFVAQRKARAEVNFAIGQHLADFAALGHAKAQNSCYQNPPCDTTNPLNGSPAQRAIDSESFFANNTQFNVEIVGFLNTPIIGGTTTFKAPSALMHIQMRGRGNTTAPPLSATDKIEILQGALRGGLKRYATSELGQPGYADPCDGSAGTSFRWGPESTACLKDDPATMGFQIADGNGTVSRGGIDWMVPTWEVAVARTGDKALYRYPQPNRPDLNVMLTNIDMTAHDIVAIDASDAQFFDSSGLTTTRPSGGAGDPGAQLVVREHKLTTINPSPLGVHVNRPATGEALRVYDQYASGGSSMTVTGDVVMASNVISVGGVMKVPQVPGQPNVTILDPVFTDNVGDPDPTKMHNVAVQPQASFTGPMDVSISNFGGLSNINNVNLTGGTGTRLAVTATVRAKSLQPPTHGTASVYASQMTANGPTTVGNNGANPDWHIGTIDQKGGRLKLLGAGVKTDDCIGTACPDNIINNPGGGI